MKKTGLLFLLLANFTMAFSQITDAELRAQLLIRDPKLTTADLEGLKVISSYTSKHNGVRHVYFMQYVNGIPVFNSVSALHFSKQGKVVAHSNQFVAEAKTITNAAQPTIGSAAALAAVGSEAQMNVMPAMQKADLPLTAGNMIKIMEHSVSNELIVMQLAYEREASALTLVYMVEIYNPTTHDWWNMRINALNGKLVSKNNYTVHCNVAHGMFGRENETTEAPMVAVQESTTAFGKSSGTGTYHVYPFPAESPNHAPRVMVTNVADDLASPYGWHDTNAVVGPEFFTTKGNNVYADEDTLANNGNGYSPDGGDSLVFDFPMDSTWMNPQSYLDASITQLFYANNVLHDVLYHYGFDEESGNFQNNNYGKGGFGNDEVQAEAQDGSGTSNANFSTPNDGSSGRMQMFLWPANGAASQSNNLRVLAPASILGLYLSPISQFGPRQFDTIEAEGVIVSDGTFADSLGCQPIVNGAELAGKIAIIYRGTCGFTQKVLNAQNAGAIAVIVITNNSQAAISMTGSNPAIVIPSVMISRADGARLRARIDAGDTLRLRLTGVPKVKAYDSDFDNGVIAHEYGHGLSNRLTGGPSASSCLTNGEQAGEGWSDFLSLVFTAKPGDSANLGRGIGTFVFNQSTSGLGIREFRYTRNMTANPMTYDYIKNNQGVHYVGTVWCSMLWDMYWNLVDKYGFDPDLHNGTGGNNIALQLVVDGLKLQTCSPGFVDARNAILQADSINNGGANSDLIWRTFARRGLGYSANQGSNMSVTDGVQAFDLPPATVGLTENDLSAYIQLHPNPSQGAVHLVVPGQLTEANIVVTDMAGKVVFQQQLRADLNHHMQLDLSNEPNGIYFVNLQHGATIFNAKVVLAR